MYKQLFLLLYRLSVYPEKTWKELSGKQEEYSREEFYRGYLYPLFGLIALFSFIGVFISRKEFVVDVALKMMIKDLLTYFSAFYLSSFALTKLLISVFRFPAERYVVERFTGYSSAVIYLVSILYSLFPSFFFLPILMLYTVYIIWQGAVFYLKLDESNWVKFTIFASVLIILLPKILDFIIALIMPGL